MNFSIPKGKMRLQCYKYTFNFHSIPIEFIGEGRSCKECGRKIDNGENYTCNQCGAQLCWDCYDNLQEDDDPYCPQCNSQLLPESEIYQSEQPSYYNKNKSNSPRSNRFEEGEGSNEHDLGKVRVIKQNLVYVIGLSPEIASEEYLLKKEYFGQYGKVTKIVVNTQNAYNPKGSNGPSFSAYVTFSSEKEASMAILGCDEFTIYDRMIRASYGTTKYCQFFLKHQDCPNLPECLYLHSFLKDKELYPKDEASSSKTIFVGQTKMATATIQKYITDLIKIKNTPLNYTPVFPSPQAVIQKLIDNELIELQIPSEVPLVQNKVDKKGKESIKPLIDQWSSDWSVPIQSIKKQESNKYPSDNSDNAPKAVKDAPLKNAQCNKLPAKLNTQINLFQEKIETGKAVTTTQQQNTTSVTGVETQNNSLASKETSKGQNSNSFNNQKIHSQDQVKTQENNKVTNGIESSKTVSNQNTSYHQALISNTPPCEARTEKNDSILLQKQSSLQNSPNDQIVTLDGFLLSSPIVFSQKSAANLTPSTTNTSGNSNLLTTIKTSLTGTPPPISEPSQVTQFSSGSPNQNICLTNSVSAEINSSFPQKENISSQSNKKKQNGNQIPSTTTSTSNSNTSSAANSRTSSINQKGFSSAPNNSSVPTTKYVPASQQNGGYYEKKDQNKNGNSTQQDTKFPKLQYIPVSTSKQSQQEQQLKDTVKETMNGAIISSTPKLQQNEKQQTTRNSQPITSKINDTAIISTNQPEKEKCQKESEQLSSGEDQNKLEYRPKYRLQKVEKREKQYSVDHQIMKKLIHNSHQRQSSSRFEFAQKTNPSEPQDEFDILTYVFDGHYLHLTKQYPNKQTGNISLRLTNW